MTTVTAVRGTAPDLRRAGDALPHAPIGTVPILWYNADPEVGRWDAPAILDEIARLGYEGTQLGTDFPTGATLRVELSATRSPTGRGVRADPDDRRRTDLGGDGGRRRVPDPAARGGRRRPVRRRRRLGRPGRAGRPRRRARHAGPHRRRLGGADRAPPRGRATPLRELGHTMVFHPHAATYVETLDEIDRLLRSTDPERIGVCLDTGHHLVARWRSGRRPAGTRRAGPTTCTSRTSIRMSWRVCARRAYAGMADAVRAGPVHRARRRARWTSTGSSPPSRHGPMTAGSWSSRISSLGPAVRERGDRPACAGRLASTARRGPGRSGYAVRMASSVPAGSGGSMPACLKATPGVDGVVVGRRRCGPRPRRCTDRRHRVGAHHRRRPGRR